MKGRSGSGGPIINAMGKALMANFTPSKNGGRNLENFADIFTSKDGSLIPNKHRAFLMDTQVKYTVVSVYNVTFYITWYVHFIDPIKNKVSIKSPCSYLSIKHF